jgi:FkbM family methyltransferase
VDGQIACYPRHRMEFARQLVRPLKRRAAALLGRDIIWKPTAHVPLEWHGSTYGGRMIRAHSLDSSSTVYSFGVGRDITFDLSIIKHYNCLVHGFDPTPESIEYVRDRHFRGFVMHDYGLSDASGRATLYAPRNTEHITGSIIRASQLAPTGVDVPLKCLPDILAELHHARIDVLKMDIEGAEYRVIASIADDPLVGRIDQLCIEFHHRFDTIDVRQTREAIDHLSARGFEAAWVSNRGEEFLFVRT